MSGSSKPLPRQTIYSAPFWDAARRGELAMQSCEACGGLQHPAGPVCRECWSDRLVWRSVSGRGAIYSYTIVHRTTTGGFSGETPYAVAIVELDEGPRLTTNIVDCPLDQVRIDMPVSAVFEPNGEIFLVKFAPARDRENGGSARDGDDRR